jgi:hypothetical protein
MKNLADAIVYAVAYIDSRDSDEDDDDVKALESIAGLLQGATAAEQDALADAANRASREALAFKRPGQDSVNVYASWMESMYGGENWAGNARRGKQEG